MYEVLTEFIVVSLAMMYARNYFTVTAFAMVVTFVVSHYIMISLIGINPSDNQQDYTMYLVVMFIFFTVFAFCFAYLLSIQHCVTYMVMMSLVSIQAIMCLALIYNGGDFKSVFFGEIHFNESDNVTFIVAKINDMIWTVECVTAWIAAYIARNGKCFKG